MQNQIINIPEIPVLYLGVSDPFLILSKSQTGIPVRYNLISGEDVLEVIGAEIIAKGTGTASLEAWVPVDGEFDRTSITFNVQVEDSTFYDRINAIAKKKQLLDEDIKTMKSISKLSLFDLTNMSSEIKEDKAILTINNQEFEINNKNVVLKFFDSSIPFLQAEIEKELLILDSFISSMKQTNP